MGQGRGYAEYAVLMYYCHYHLITINDSTREIYIQWYLDNRPSVIDYSPITGKKLVLVPIFLSDYRDIFGRLYGHFKLPL